MNDEMLNVYLKTLLKAVKRALLWYGIWSPTVRFPDSPGPQRSLSRPIEMFHQSPPIEPKAR